MNSLSVHLRSTESHDALTFHAACPICAEHRLAGQIAARPLVPLRAQAALVAGLMAVSATGSISATALAAEPDSTHDGTAPVPQAAPPDPADSGSFDPGGDTSDLTDQPQPAAATPAPTATSPADAADDNGPPDAAPTKDESDPTVDPGDGTDSVPAAATTPTPTTAPPATASETAAPPAAARPSGASTVQSAPATASVPAPAPVPTAPPTAVPQKAKPNRHIVGRHRSVSQQRQAATPAIVLTPAAATPAVTTPTPVRAAIATTSEATASDAIHVVQPGESLWAIASDVLGADASPARIAREVHHLWQLNQDRIGTGNPDLVMAGTKLVLR